MEPQGWKQGGVWAALDQMECKAWAICHPQAIHVRRLQYFPLDRSMRQQQGVYIKKTTVGPGLIVAVSNTLGLSRSTPSSTIRSRVFSPRSDLSQLINVSIALHPVSFDSSVSWGECLHIMQCNTCFLYGEFTFRVFQTQLINISSVCILIINQGLPQQPKGMVGSSDRMTNLTDSSGISLQRERQIVKEEYRASIKTWMGYNKELNYFTIRAPGKIHSWQQRLPLLKPAF